MLRNPNGGITDANSVGDVEHVSQRRRPMCALGVGSFSSPCAALPETAALLARADAPARAGPSLVAGEPGLLQRCVAESAHLCFVAAAPDGRVRAVNGALATRLGYAPRALAARDVWSLLTDADATHLRLCALHGWMAAPEPALLTFVGAEGEHFTLRCLVEVDPDGLVVVGEPPRVGGT